MSGFRELEVYRRSYVAAKAMYELTKGFPAEEKYGITNQMRRASLSIPMNIAEGYAKRESQSELKRFLMMAIGSSNELQVLLEFSKDIGYLEEAQYAKATDEYEQISRMLNKFIQHLATKSKI